MQKDKVSIKPSYNEGIAVCGGFVLNYELSQISSDHSNFIDLIEGVEENTGDLPEVIHSDGAYDNEENMSYLEEAGIGNYLKFHSFGGEQSKKWHQAKVRKEDFLYEKEFDRYRCPHGAFLPFVEEREKTLKSGYVKTVRLYQADKEDCGQCPFKDACTSAESRGIEVSEKYEKLKDNARGNLFSEYGKDLRSRRGFEVETVFGDKKQNNRYRRFMLREMSKVEIEVGLYYTSHNLRKLYGRILRLLFENKLNKPRLLEIT